MKKALLTAAFSILGAAVLGLLLRTPLVQAQSGTRIVPQTQGGSRPTGQGQVANRAVQQAHYDKLWAWMQQADYCKWNGANGQTPDFQEGKSPHGALIKTYVNDVATGDLRKLPNGTVIVKENYSPDKKLMAITVMQRSADYDREHGDWYYAKYLPNGKIDVTPPQMMSMPVAGKFMMCIECHSGAGGGDYAFLND